MSCNEHKAGQIPNRPPPEWPKNRWAASVANGKSFAPLWPVHR